MLQKYRDICSLALEIKMSPVSERYRAILLDVLQIIGGFTGNKPVE
jgi:hypothetical protein